MTGGIIFDSGPVISLTVNNMLWLIDELKEKFEGDFYIPVSVKRELIDVPLETKKFKFEALQIMDSVRRGIIRVHPQTEELKTLTNELLEIANSCYICKKTYMKIIHYAEMEVVALAMIIKAEAIVVDERMMRVIIEDPESISRLLTKRYKCKVSPVKENLKKLADRIRGVNLVRSTELATVAFEKGWLNHYLPRRMGAVRRPKKVLLQAILWGLKLHGCSISQREIDEVVKSIVK